MESTSPRSSRLAAAAGARRRVLALLTLALISLPRIGAAVPHFATNDNLSVDQV